VETREVARLARVALAALLLAGAAGARAQPYPNRPVQVIVAFPPGGSVDVMARHLVAGISSLLGQPFVVVNREGASGSVGFGVLAASAPDGYTLGAGPTTPISIATHMMKEVKYTPDSFEYVCQSFENIFTISVLPDSRFKSIADLIAEARERPGKLSYGHSGNGTIPHLSVSNLAYRLKLDILAVPYRGETQALVDVLAGRHDFGAPSVAVVASQKMRVLAVFADRRHPAFPDAPTFSELGMPSMPPGLNGLFAPRGTPPEALLRLERACEQTTRSDAFRAAAQKVFAPIVFLDRAGFTERAWTDYRYRGELIRALGLKAE
jgi:tripartite-type tricarboxylate transporter receptor subunit TctC